MGEALLVMWGVIGFAAVIGATLGFGEAVLSLLVDLPDLARRAAASIRCAVSPRARARRDAERARAAAAIESARVVERERRRAAYERRVALNAARDRRRARRAAGGR